jgi:dolichol-phosphate mannosyltransferase
MPDPLPLLSVVSPAFNEAEGLPHFHAALAAVLDQMAGAYRTEIIYVDDGSRDGTLAVLRRLAVEDGRVRYLSLSRNFGNQAALTAGLEHAAGDAVITMDSDLQHPPSLIPTLVEKWRLGSDVVLTVRAGGTDRTQNWLKRNASTMFHDLLRRWSSLDVRPGASDYRLLSRRAIDNLLRLGEAHRYVRGLVQWLGFPEAEVPFDTAPRFAGVSRYTFGRLMRLAFDGLLSFSRMPLQVTIAGGLTAVGMSFVVCSGLVLAYRPDAVTIAGLLAVHIVGASVLASVGVLGAYVVRIFEESKGRPLYVVKESWPATMGISGRQLGPHIGRRDANAA